MTNPSKLRQYYGQGEVIGNGTVPYTTDLALPDRLFGVRQYRESAVGKNLNVPQVKEARLLFRIDFGRPRRIRTAIDSVQRRLAN